MADAIDSGYRLGCLEDIPSDFSVSYLINKDEISLKAKQQGFRYFQEGYFHDVKISVREEKVVVGAKCYRSQRKSEKPHTVNFDVSNSQISFAYCSCQAGLSGSCSHVVGLVQAVHQWQLMGFTRVPEELSCTSLPQSWSVPRGPKIEPEPVPSLTFVNPKMERKRVPLQNKMYDVRNVTVTDEDMNHLQSLKELPISYIATKQPTQVDTHLGRVPVGSFLAAQAQFYEEKENRSVTTTCGDLTFPKEAKIPSLLPAMTTALTIEECKVLEEKTRDQSNCELWFKERKGRLTASKFGIIVKRKKVTDKFINEIKNPKGFSAASTTYGKNSERKAIAAYMAKSGNHTHKCGLLVNPKYPYLGASPDGIICVDNVCGLLEVKCPFSARDNTIREACETVKDFCLEDQNGEIKLKKEHIYFYQVQGQLLVAGAEFCDFVVYTKKDIHIQRISFDENFCASLLNSLTDFYSNYIM